MATDRCAQVIETPEITKRIVFNSGKLPGCIMLIPSNGHSDPKTIEGHNEEWKKAQKKPKKSITSEEINKRKPKIKPRRTIKVWWPTKLASSETSLNQLNAQIKRANKPNKLTSPPNSIRCMKKAKPETNKKTEEPTKKGHGLGLTKWNKWRRLEDI